MVGQLYAAHLTRLIPGGNAQRVLAQCSTECRVDAKVAVVAFIAAERPIGQGDTRVRFKSYCAALLHQRTTQWRNHLSPARLCFGVTRILPLQHIARVFDDRILKSAAGAQERFAAFPRPANGVEDTRVIMIRTARHDPDSIALRQMRLAKLFSGDPFCFRSDVQPTGGTFNRKGNSLMGNRTGAVITDQ